MEWVGLSPCLDIAFIGPPLDAGRLPSVFYFALSAQESLDLDPFNQPALCLSGKGIRVFSLNLPAHGPGYSSLDAIGMWAQELMAKRDPLTPFTDRVVEAIEAVIERGWAVREKIGVMGLSRGGWIALHSMAKTPWIHSAVGFAPLIDLSKAREFQQQQVACDPSLEIPLDPLIDRPIRLYIGNRDSRVGTRRCCDFVSNLAEASFQRDIRSPPIELIVSPSIGHMGHGTSKEAFSQGATWLARQLGDM